MASKEKREYGKRHLPAHMKDAGIPIPQRIIDKVEASYGLGKSNVLQHISEILQSMYPDGKHFHQHSQIPQRDGIARLSNGSLGLDYADGGTIPEHRKIVEEDEDAFDAGENNS